MNNGSDCDLLVNSDSYRGPPLRRWQKEALEIWEGRDHRGVVEAITGTGKSLLGIAAIHQTVVKDGGKALLLVPTRALLDQWSRLVVQSLPTVKVGTLTSGSTDTFRSSDVLVSTVQTAWKSPPIPISLGLLVGDEVHRYGSERYSRALHHSYQRRLGLTGTFERQLDDGVDRFLLPYFRSVTTSYGYALALKEKVVAPFDLAFVAADFSPSERSAYEEATARCSDAQADLIGNFGYPAEWPQFFAEVTRRINKDAYRDEESDLCAQYLSGFAERRRLTAEAAAKESFVGKLAASFRSFSGSLVFTETKESARRLGWIIDRVTPAFPLTSDSSSAEREAKLRAFSAGRIKVLCAPRILDEGVDVPEAEVAIIVAASKTARQMIQRMGRVVRRKADGRSARIVIMYIKGTGEDPELGGHEAFLNAVRPFATSELMTSVESPETLIDWLHARPSGIDGAIAVSATKPPPQKVTAGKYNRFDGYGSLGSERAGPENKAIGRTPNSENPGFLDGARKMSRSSGGGIEPVPNAYQIDSYRTFPGKLRALAALSQAEIVRDAVRIVAEEGPVLGYRIHDLFQGVPSSYWTTKESGRTLNTALTLAITSGELRATNPLGESGVKPLTFYLPGQPQVNVRALGPRALNRVPPSELFELMRRVADVQMISGTDLGSATLEALGSDPYASGSHRRLMQIFDAMGPFE
ncbi:MAG: hypothetical protein JWQ12_1742 [Glaciihabitans sp.]|nr:hypothetical protein [Glaciihabitans sp.]